MYHSPNHLLFLPPPSLPTFFLKRICMKVSIILTRRQDSSIGFGAPVRANMRAGGITNSVVTSSLLESVWIRDLSNQLDALKINTPAPQKKNEKKWKMDKLIGNISWKWGLNATLFIFQVESSDLIAYGLIPEFIGRFPILVSLSALTEDQLVQVCINAFVLGISTLLVLDLLLFLFVSSF